MTTIGDTAGLAEQLDEIILTDAPPQMTLLGTGRHTLPRLREKIEQLEWLAGCRIETRMAILRAGKVYLPTPEREAELRAAFFGDRRTGPGVEIPAWLTRVNVVYDGDEIAGWVPSTQYMTRAKTANTLGLDSAASAAERLEYARSRLARLEAVWAAKGAATEAAHSANLAAEERAKRIGNARRRRKAARRALAAYQRDEAKYRASGQDIDAMMGSCRETIDECSRILAECDA